MEIRKYLFSGLLSPVWSLIGLMTFIQGVIAAETNGTNTEPALAQTQVELTFIKGDSYNGSKTKVRIVGDSLQYEVTTYRPSQAPIQTLQSAHLSVHRRISLKNVRGDLPHYPAFGSCFGKGMKYYLVETPEGKFYRSLPEHAGRCYSQEPGIWSLFQDLDDLVAPPSESEYREYPSAS